MDDDAIVEWIYVAVALLTIGVALFSSPVIIVVEQARCSVHRAPLALLAAAAAAADVATRFADFRAAN